MAVKHKRVDVVTVGGGWTANILAWKLTAAGQRVVSLEQGPERWANPDFAHNHDSLQYSVRKAMMVNLGRESWTWRPDAKAPSLPMRQFGAFHPGQGVGGSAIHWSGMLWRFLPSDFNYRSHYIERYGEQIIPENSAVQDWPINYEDLEPYYDAFEYDIGASGQTGNLNGVIIDGGNPFEGPRSRPYPLPPLTPTLAAERFAKTTADMGYSPFTQPSGILSEAYTDPFGNTRSGCMYCGFCTRFGCEVDAKSTGITTHLPLALETGLHEVRANSHVVGVNLGADGLATGVTYVDAVGEEHEQPADVVILSAYTLTNVKLLLLSRGIMHPDGIGNDRGQVGRNATHQMWLSPSTGVFEGEQFNLFMGNTSTIKVIYDFNADNFDHSGLGFIGGASIFAGVGEREPLTSAGGLPVTGDKNWGRAWKEALRNDWDSFFPTVIQGESPAYEGNFFDLDPTFTDAYGRPLLRFTFDWTENEHKMYAFLAARCKEIMEQMNPTGMKTAETIDPYDIHQYKSTHINGGAIMGDNPDNSVTNSYGQVWDTPNVFVAGAALYPQNAGANPTGTLAAIAYRTGDAMVDQYLDNPNQLMS